jgi:hypothetical protein
MVNVAGAFEFSCKESLPDLDGVIIDLKKMRVITPYGVMTNPTPTESKGLLGSFSGYEWKLEKSDAAFSDITTASLSIAHSRTPAEILSTIIRVGL